MEKMKNKNISILICIVISLFAFFLGKIYPIVGAPVIGLLFGMIICTLLKDKMGSYSEFFNIISKKTLQTAVILLGFGLNLNMIFKVGKESLPIIFATISTSLIIAFVMCRLFKIPVKTATLIGVGSSICGGSAIAATAPVIHAESEEIAQSISVIFLFNLIAALIFPTLGGILGMGHSEFAIFAGTAINDTSSVTAAAASWDSIYNTGTMVLDTATVVKLTRTLAIIPITFVLSLYYMKKEKQENGKFRVANLVPKFIILFIVCACITSLIELFVYRGIFGENIEEYSKMLFNDIKIISKFLIVMAMVAIGLNTSIEKILKSGFRTILLGASCWIGIIAVSLAFLSM